MNKFYFSLEQFKYEKLVYKVFDKVNKNTELTVAEEFDLFNKALVEFLSLDTENQILLTMYELSWQFQDIDTARLVDYKLYRKVNSLPRSSVYEIVRRMK
jgi:hypothetical protein